MRDRPDRIYIWTGFAQGFTSAWGLAAIVWWVVDVALSPLQLVLLGTALEVSVLLAETPTGVVADLYSRKWSLVASYVVMGAAMMLGPVTPVFGVLLVWQVLWGIGWTLQSGADTAWVTDELAATGDTDHPVDRLIVRHSIWRSFGLLAGLPTTAALGAWSLEGAMVLLGGSSLLAAVFFAFVMDEHGFEPITPSDRGRWADALDVWRNGARIVARSRMLRIVVGTMLVIGAADEAIDRLDVLRFVQLGLPDFADEQAVVFFGAVWIAMTILNIPVMVWLSNRLEAAPDRRAARLAQILLLVSAVGVLALALSPGFAAALIGWTVRDIAREVLEPLGVGLANRHAESEVRATVISFRGQAEAVGEVMGGVLLGTLAQVTTVPVALTAAAVLLGVAALPYASAALDHRS